MRPTSSRSSWTNSGDIVHKQPRHPLEQIATATLPTFVQHPDTAGIAQRGETEIRIYETTVLRKSASGSGQDIRQELDPVRRITSGHHGTFMTGHMSSGDL